MTRRTTKQRRAARRRRLAVQFRRDANAAVVRDVLAALAEPNWLLEVLRRERERGAP